MSQQTLEAIRFNQDENTLEILDQLLLPYNTKYINIESIDDAYNAIKLMQVRGAPAIAIVGAFAVAVDISKSLQAKKEYTAAQLVEKIDYLVTSRPTAVNLSNVLTEIKQLLGSSFKDTDLVNEALFDVVKKHSVALHQSDLDNNYKLGDNGVKYISETLKLQNFKGPFSIVTVCNTGSLATSGHGTALGIIRSVHSQLTKEAGNDFWFEHAYPLETRPYNQGARLTTYELAYEKIPFTLICDNMVTSLISSLSKKKAVKSNVAPVKFIIVGADRVVKNGDSANKIGTFQLAAIADYFNLTSAKEEEKIKFIVAAPNTTVDHKTATGDDIVIEERPPHELTTLEGPLVRKDGTVGEKTVVGIATPGIQVWNPAFDVTPHELIDAIITEDFPVHEKRDGEFSL